MTAHNVIRLPVPEAAFDRIVARDREANIAAERVQAVKTARAVLRAPEAFTDAILRDACAALQAWGDATDYLQADAMIFALNKRERDQAHEAARRETSASIALRHLPKWPALLAGAVAFVGFWWGVVALVMGVGG